MQFYKLPQKWQSLYTMNGGHPYRDIKAVESEEDPWHVSGGMSNVDKRRWRNATGLALPKGELIEVFEEWQDVGAFGPVPKIRWRFPNGTKAYDVLFAKESDGSEHVFEVRVHERHDSGWDSGTTYRPEPESVGERRGWTWSFPNVGLDADATVYAATFSDAPKFVEAKRVAVDGGRFTPSGYLGAGMACNACHRRVGEKTGYALGRRGDDGRFSWHPFDESGRIDARWPIRKK